MFYPAKPPAHWLMVAEVDGKVLMVPLAPARDGNPTRCRPIGCYEASKHLSEAFTHAGGAQPRNPDLIRNLYASVLAYTCNLGYAGMADASGISE
jgi:hypothetical protein